MKGKSDTCQVSVWAQPVAQWYNIKDLVWLCHCSALRCQRHPRAGPQHGHGMVISSSLVSSGKQRAPSRKHQYLESVMSGQSLKVQVSREIPCANWLQPMIFSRNHCRKQGGINLTGLDQSELASHSCVCGQSLPKQMSVAQWEKEWRADELHPGYKWGRLKQKPVRAVCKIGLSQRSGAVQLLPFLLPSPKAHPVTITEELQPGQSWHVLSPGGWLRTSHHPGCKNDSTSRTPCFWKFVPENMNGAHSWQRAEHWLRDNFAF